MNYYSMKRMVLTGVAVVMIVAGLASPALAEEVRDHRDGGSSVGTIADPVKDSGKNNEGIVADPVKDSGKDNQGIVVDPVRDSGKDDEKGIIVDPVRDPGKDNADDASKTQDPILIHCSPGVGCSKEDSDAPKDGQDSSTNSEKDPILIHCSPGSGCSKEDSDTSKDERSSAPEAVQDGEVHGAMPSTAIENNVSSQQAPTTSADAQANSASNVGEIHGCPFNYNYSDTFGTCFPSDSDLGFDTVLGGQKPFPTTLGGGISFVGSFPGDSLQLLGPVLIAGADSLGDFLVDFGDGGGPIGWGLQGLGYTVGYVGDIAGGLAEGIGAGIDAVSNGVGAAIDDIGSALGSLF